MTKNLDDAIFYPYNSVIWIDDFRTYQSNHSFEQKNNSINIISDLLLNFFSTYYSKIMKEIAYSNLLRYDLIQK